MIHLLLTINPTDVPPARPAQPKVVEEKKQLKAPTQAFQQADNSPRVSYLGNKSPVSKPKSNTGAPPIIKEAMISPSRQTTKRKTVINEDGVRKVVSGNAIPGSPSDPKAHGQGTNSAHRLESRRLKKSAKVNDIFGDFFGFGPNPPGCMSKGTEPIDLKKEKEKFI